MWESNPVFSLEGRRFEPLSYISHNILVGVIGIEPMRRCFTDTTRNPVDTPLFRFSFIFRLRYRITISVSRAYGIRNHLLFLCAREVTNPSSPKPRLIIYSSIFQSTLNFLLFSFYQFYYKNLLEVILVFLYFSF